MCDTAQASAPGVSEEGGKVVLIVQVKGTGQTQRKHGSLRQVQLAQASHNTEAERGTWSGGQSQAFLVCPAKESFSLKEQGKPHTCLEGTMQLNDRWLEGLEWECEAVRPWCQSEKGNAGSTSRKQD